MSKQALVNTLGEYFAKNGGFMTLEAYRDAADAPVRIQIIKRSIGSWARLRSLLGYTDAPVAAVAQPVVEPVVEPVAEPVVEPVAEPVVEPVVVAKTTSKSKGA